MHTSALCVITRRCLHFSASNPFDGLYARFYPGRSAENREDLRNLKERETYIAIGKAVAGGPIKTLKPRIGSRGKTSSWPFVLSFIPNSVGSFAAYLLFERQIDREPASLPPFSEAKQRKTILTIKKMGFAWFLLRFIDIELKSNRRQMQF